MKGTIFGYLEGFLPLFTFKYKINCFYEKKKSFLQIPGIAVSKIRIFKLISTM